MHYRLSWCALLPKPYKLQNMPAVIPVIGDNLTATVMDVLA